VRFLATLLLWLLTTAALAVALPAAWAQVNVVDREGYSALAASAARDPALQSAVAAELTTQLVRLGSNSGYEPNETLFGLAARAYTASPAFPGQFALANQVAHRWLFTDTVGQSDESGRWTIGIKAPSTLSIPLTEDVSNSLRPGQLHRVAQWGPWVSIGAAVITGMLALLTLIVTRSRGKVLGALGISALLVGAAGWAGIEVGRPYVNTALNDTSGNVRRIADAMVDHAIGSMHLWLNLTLGVGGVLVFIGFVVSTLGGLGKRD
jgi:hypothetical protein